MFSKIYDFTKDCHAASFYNKEQGFGLIDFDTVPGETQAEKSLYGGGWNHRPSDGSHFKDCYRDTAAGVQITEDRQVLCFKADVPEYGTYEISLTLAAGEDPVQSLTIFAGRRNLIRRGAAIPAGQEQEYTFYTYVTPYIPALTNIPIEEKAVYVSLLGKGATIRSLCIRKKEVPTFFIAGDSTLTDQNALTPYYPIASCCGWAQDLSAYVKNAAVCNYAHSGLTTNCFKDDGHWDILKEQIRPGDFFLIQFGHNDQKRRNLSAFGGYYDNLKWYAARVRELGAFPILCSPISRVPLKDETGFHSLLSRHALAVKEAAKECGTPFINLHDLTFDQWLGMDETALKDYFIPGDITHTSDYGAKLIADLVAEALSNISETAPYIATRKLPDFLPASDVKSAPKEPAPEKGMFDMEPPYIDIKGCSKYDGICNAFQHGLLDPCVMMLHPDSILPRAQLLMVYFKALRMAGERPYLGKYCDIDRYEWDSSYVQACIREDLIDETTAVNGYFRPDDPLTYEEFASFCILGLEKEKEHRKTLTLTDCFRAARECGIIDADAEPKASITRQDVYSGLAVLMDLLDNADAALPKDAEIHPVG